MQVPERDARAIMPTYGRLPLDITHGEGAYIFDRAGNRYLDLFGGLAVNLLGNAHPRMVAAAEKQLRLYAHLSNYFAQEPQVLLAERLKELTGYPAVYFCNSGTEAAEAAVKLARKWGSTRSKTTLIGFSGAFHGRSMSPLSLMSHAPYREGYQPFLDGCLHLPWNDTAALERSVHSDTAAVFLEPIQGEGGIVPASETFIEALSRLREKYGFLIVADEVQTGVGRTGTFLAADPGLLRPDVVMLAKGIGGGLPLGALLVREEFSGVFGRGGHGSTFGGNPVACAAGLAVLDVIRDEKLMSRALHIGETIMNAMRAFARESSHMIVDVRGRGCMIGIELAAPAYPVLRRCLEQGVLINVTRERVIRLLPPLILSDEQCDVAVETLRACIPAAFEDAA